jgi:hypothetical protein
MASNLKYSTPLKNAIQNAITTAAGAGAILNLYSGAQPASPDVAVGAQVLLASGVCSAALAAAAAGGVLTANAIANGTGLAAAGSPGTAATWYRLTTSGGVALVDGSVATAGADFNMTGTTVIATGIPVQFNGYTLTNGN